MLREIPGADPSLLHPAVLVGCFVKMVRVTAYNEQGVEYTRNHSLLFSTRMDQLKTRMPDWVELFSCKAVLPDSPFVKELLQRQVSIDRPEQTNVQ
jgi:hypothetical protein